MVKHIVLWTLKEGIDREATYKKLFEGFNAFKNDVPGMRSLDLQLGFDGWDICLESIHDDKEALAAYQCFPQHVAMKEIVAQTRDKRAACDFYLE